MSDSLAGNSVGEAKTARGGTVSGDDCVMINLCVSEQNNVCVSGGKEVCRFNYYLSENGKRCV